MVNLYTERCFPAINRSGFTMLELTVAASVLGMVFLVTIPLLTKVRDTREEAQRRFVAQLEAANTLERLSLRVADGTLDEAMSQNTSISSEAASVLPEGEIDITPAEQVDDVGNLQITVAVSWLDNAGQRVSPVSLDAWFPVSEQQP